MLNPFKLSPIVLLSAVAVFVVGELLTGTSINFVMPMAVTMVCIGITYNILGGLASIGGLAFSALALRTIVISQIGKIVLVEPADQNLEAPQLTITIYMVFYICLMLGTFVFGRIRLGLPRVWEPVTEAQTSKLYNISMILGSLAFLSMSMSGGGEQAAGRAFGLAFSNLLLFSLVLGVQSQIRATDGLHSFGIKAFVPWLICVLAGIVGTSRGGIIIPSLAYALACYASGFRFRRKHYIAAVVGVVVMVAVVSPFAMYARQFRGGTLREGVMTIYNSIVSMPDWTVVKESSQEAEDAGEGRSNYFSRPGTFVLSRLSLIRKDSNLISACSGGYHYGFIALKADLLLLIPNFLYRDKPTIRSNGFIGHVSGMTADDMDINHTTTTAIGDSFGAFGWMGVVLTGLLAFPTAIVVYESMFDLRGPWGTVTLGILCSSLPESNLGSLAGLTLRMPIDLLLLSLFLWTIVRFLPSKGAN